MAFEENRNNPKTIWKTIKTLTGTNKKVNEVRSLNDNGVVINDSTEMAKKFNLHFSTVIWKTRTTYLENTDNISGKHGQHGHGQHAKSNPNPNPNPDFYFT